MSTWQIVIWALGSLGIAGTIAAMVLYPAIVSMVFRGVVAGFNLVLGYRLGCAIVAAIVAGLAVDYWRHSHDDKAYADRTALFEHAQKARDARITEEAKQAVWIEIANETAANTATDNEVKELIHEAPPLPKGNDCRRVGDASERLHIIAGQIDRRSKGNRAVPAIRRPGPRTGL